MLGTEEMSIDVTQKDDSVCFTLTGSQPCCFVVTTTLYLILLTSSAGTQRVVVEMCLLDLFIPVC